MGISHRWASVVAVGLLTKVHKTAAFNSDPIRRVHSIFGLQMNLVNDSQVNVNLAELKNDE